MIKQQPGKEIAKIYPKEWINFSKKNFYYFILVYILAIIYTFFGIKIDNLFATIIIFFVFILYTILFLYAYFNLFKVPILLNEDKMALTENKFKVALFKRRKYIKFKDIRKINNIGKEMEWWKFTIFLKNDKKIKLYLDELEDINMILDTYKKYKSQKEEK